MTGKRHLSRGREDSQVPRVARLRWEYERALGEVELARDLLHLEFRETGCLGQYGQRISPETRLRKQTSRVVPLLHRTNPLDSFPAVSPSCPISQRALKTPRSISAAGKAPD